MEPSGYVKVISQKVLYFPESWILTKFFCVNKVSENELKLTMNPSFPDF